VLQLRCRDPKLQPGEEGDGRGCARSADAGALLTPHPLHPTPDTLHPTPYTLHPTPCTEQGTRSCAHHGPCHPTPSTAPQRDWYLIAEEPAPAPHLARPEGRAALRIVLVTVPRASRSCDLHRARHLTRCRAGAWSLGLSASFVVLPYRGTSLMRNSAPLGPYSRTMPRALPRS